MKIQYVADDGTIFDSARECRAYEEQQARSTSGCLGFILGVCIALVMVVMAVTCGII